MDKPHSAEDMLPCEIEEHDDVMREIAEKNYRRLETNQTSLTCFFDELNKQGEVTGVSFDGQYMAAGGQVDAEALLNMGLCEAGVTWHVLCPDGVTREIKVVNQVVRSWKSCQWFRNIFNIAYQ